jgi:hypothetical protein
MLMETYKVETVEVKKRYACILVEAGSKREAIDKAKKMDWKDFDETELADRSTWEVKKTSSFIQIINFLFRRKE